MSEPTAPEDRFDTGDGEQDEPRRPLTWLSEGLALSQRVLVVAFSLGLPVLAGAAVDRFWPFSPQVPVGVLAGSFFGMIAGGWQLWCLTNWLAARNLALKPSAKRTLGS